MKERIAQLLIEIGLDAEDAEKEAARLEKRLGKLGEAGKKSGEGVDKSKKEIDRWAKAAEGAGKAADLLMKGMIAIGGVVLGLGHQVLSTGATFESLKASLKTVTGSAGAAEDALDFIRAFTIKTPFQLEEVSKAFIKLKAYGLEPSERALTAYGDTASSMTKSLDDMIEAVADATTGEFERLKEFGIKAKKDGDLITFTFRGVRTEVRNNAKAIQDYLVGLGEANFAGAMADQSVTLTGLVSNLKDALTEFFLAVANMGPLEEFKLLIGDIRDKAGDKDGLAKTLARTLTSAIRAVRNLIAGDFVGTLEKLAKILEFVVDNFDIFIGLIGGAKTMQAFGAVRAGFTAMGFAATGALGPIGAIMAAFIALIPVALKAGNAIGDAISKDRNRGGLTTDKRGGATFLGDVAEHNPALAAKIAEANEDLETAQKRFDRANAKGTGMFSGNRTSVINAEAELKKAQTRVNKLNASAKLSTEKGEREIREAAERKAQEDQDLMMEFGDLDVGVSQIAAELGIEIDEVTGDVSGGGDKAQSALDAAIMEFAVSGDLKKARKAAGLDKKKGGGGKKGKKDKKVTSPTSVSEFFAAAARGDLGPIAAKTPSTKDIEPTVAVDITNNNYTFKIEQTISGTTDAIAIGKEAAIQIEAFWTKKIGQAGQSSNTNMKR